jgi:hypothetical protein
MSIEHIYKIKMYTILLSGELMIPISIVDWILLVALEFMLFGISLYQLCCY